MLWQVTSIRRRSLNSVLGLARRGAGRVGQTGDTVEVVRGRSLA